MEKIWIAIRVVGPKGGHPFWNIYRTKKNAVRAIIHVLNKYMEFDKKYRVLVATDDTDYTEYSKEELWQLGDQLWREYCNENSK